MYNLYMFDQARKTFWALSWKWVKENAKNFQMKHNRVQSMQSGLKSNMFLQ